MVTKDDGHVESLIPDARAVLDLDDKARVDYIRKEKWIPYTRANEILASLEELLITPKKSRMPSILVVGDSNNGKSSIAQEFLRRHPPTNGIESDAYPVIWIEAPNTPDEGRLYNNILKHLLVPFKYKDMPSKKEHEVDYYFQKLGTRMLIVDDIHNILSGPVTKQRIFMNALKTLNNRLYIPIVLLGIETALQAVATDKQMSSRFPPIALPKWKPNQEYVSLLLSIEMILPLRITSNLASEELAPLILDLSEGYIGDIVELTNTAAIYAIQTGTERITSSVISACGYIRPSQRSLNVGLEIA
jgi:TniB protein